MTNEEMAMLIQQGHKEYCSELWERVQKLISMLIGKKSKNRVLPNDIDSEDLHQCGFFAMLAAVKAYNPDKGYKFNTYLEYHVKNAISETINHGKRVGQNTPTIKEYSYNTTIAGNDREETEHIELMQDENSLYEYEPLEISDLQSHVWQAVAELPDRQQEVIRRYFLQGTSLTDIAKEKALSVENIRARKNQGLQMLRRNRELRQLYRDYIRSACLDISSYEFYWLRSPEKYVIEKDIYKRKLQGEYISYGKEQSILYIAMQRYIKAQIDNARYNKRVCGVK